MMSFHTRALVSIVLLGISLIACGCEKPQVREKSQEKDVPKERQDLTVDIGSSITLEMVFIPEGTFMIGSPSSEKGRDDEEGPQSKVKVEAFWMGKHEITQEQYETIMGTNPSRFNGIKNPVEQVSWNDAMEFCRRISNSTEKYFSLPTEDQWEYAGRAGSQTRFYFGDSDRSFGEYAWFDSNSGNRTHPVGTKKPNKWGLFDIHGNVWEWNLSIYMRYPYTDNLDWRNDHTALGGRTIRGGSFRGTPNSCRMARRFTDAIISKQEYIGFRIVCIPTQVEPNLQNTEMTAE